jgi:uncharacterized protein YggU (UPF0235/DUF167 family)
MARRALGAGLPPSPARSCFATPAALFPSLPVAACYTSGVATISVRVTPRSSRPGLEWTPEGVLHVRVRSAPERGRANAEAAELLAQALRVPNNAVRVARGARSRTKILAIEGVDDETLIGRLQAL